MYGLCCYKHVLSTQTDFGLKKCFDLSSSCQRNIIPRDLASSCNRQILWIHRYTMYYDLHRFMHHGEPLSSFLPGHGLFYVGKTWYTITESIWTVFFDKGAKWGINAFAKSIDPCQVARYAQADMGRYFSPSLKPWSHRTNQRVTDKKLFYPFISVLCSFLIRWIRSLSCDGRWCPFRPVLSFERVKNFPPDKTDRDARFISGHYVA